MRIGVMGGTFDPIHLAHLVLAEQAREQLALDKVFFIPAGDPWRKAGREITPAPHRLAMTRLAVQDHDAFEVDDCELRRTGPSYTLDTLRELRARPGASEDDELFVLVGEDALADLPHWHDPAGIAAEAVIVVAPREGVSVPDSLPFDPDRLVYIQMPYLEISATDLRQRARLGRSLRYLVPEPVRAYIIDNALYQT
jgi:nicotinate-nucleotide adenylyltransferase